MSDYYHKDTEENTGKVLKTASYTGTDGKTYTYVPDEVTEWATDGLPRRINGRFPKGLSGNPSGRPKGSRNVLSKSVLGTYAKEAANGDFERVMANLKVENPAVYAKLLNDAAMKEAERIASKQHGGLCEQCGGELDSKTILNIEFVEPPALDSDQEHTSD